MTYQLITSLSLSAGFPLAYLHDL